MVSMRPAALHDEQRIVLLVWFWNVLDCGFPVLSAFHESPELLSAEHYPQAGFPAAPYADDPAQTFFLRGISLHVGHRHGGLALVVEILACAAAASILAVCVHPPCVGAAVFQSAWCRELSSVPALLLWWTPLRFAGHRHVWPAPAALVAVRSVTVAVLAGCAHRPCADAVHFLPMARSLWYAAAAPT